MNNKDKFSNSDQNSNQFQSNNNSQTPEEAQTLYERAKQEWLDSGISEDVIALNLKVADGHSGLDKFFTECNFEKKDRTNTGKLSDSILGKYSHLSPGYWYCESYNPITDEIEIPQVKPSQPRRYYDKLNGVRFV